MPKKLRIVPIVKQETTKVEITTGVCFICRTELEYMCQPVRTPTGDWTTPCPDAPRICGGCRQDPQLLKETRIEAERHYQQDHHRFGLIEGVKVPKVEASI